MTPKTKALVAAVLIAVVVVGVVAYIALAGPHADVSQGGITAQVQRCEASGDSFTLTVLLTADPSKVSLHVINAQTGQIGWSGKVGLSGYGLTTPMQGFQAPQGLWTTDAPITVSVAQVPGYGCQLTGWTPVLG